MQIEATKVFMIDSAHRLDWHKGKCQRFHGHCWKIELTYKGKLNIIKYYHEKNWKVRTIKNINELLRLEKYITQLWESRGVKWND